MLNEIFIQCTPSIVCKYWSILLMLFHPSTARSVWVWGHVVWRWNISRCHFTFVTPPLPRRHNESCHFQYYEIDNITDRMTYDRRCIMHQLRTAFRESLYQNKPGNNNLKDNWHLHWLYCYLVLCNDWLKIEILVNNNTHSSDYD